MKAIFIYNPMSGDGNIYQKLDEIFGLFQKSGILLQPFRLFDNESDKLSKILSQEAFDFAVVSGGDGTIGLVADIIMKNNVNLPVGIIPAGTCNNFAGNLKIPASVDKSAYIILSGKPKDIDLCLINNEKYFLTSCSGGLFASASFNTDDNLKKSLGTFAYYLKAIGGMTTVKPFKLKIETDTGKIDEEALFFQVSNGEKGLGSSNLINRSDISDGVMDLMVIKSCSYIELLGIFAGILSNDVSDNCNIISLKTKHCRIESDNDIDIAVDGEKGPSFPLDIYCKSRAIRVFADL